VKAWTAAFVGFLAFQEDPAVKELAKGYRHAWEGFGGGSWVKVRETSRRPEIDDGGNLVYRPIVEERLYTLLRPEGERPHLKIEGGGHESVVPFFAGPPSWLRGKAEPQGEEKIAVGGRTYACAVTRIALDEGKDASQATTVARAPDAPVWAVRLRIETFANGVRNTLEEHLLVEEGRALKVGDREVVCQVVQVTVEGVGGGKTVRREWRSDAVPGRVVRSEVRQFLNGKEVQAAGSVMEVASFRAIK